MNSDHFLSKDKKKVPDMIPSAFLHHNIRLLPPLIILFLSIHLTSPCPAQKFLTFQTYNVDSLLEVLPLQDGEEEVDALNQLAVSLFFKDTVVSRQYTDEAMELARALDYQEGIGDAYRNYGYIDQFRGNFPQALIKYLDALSVYEGAGCRGKAMDVYYDIAKTHFLARNYRKTIEIGNMALEKFAERLDDGTTAGDALDSALCLGGMGHTYRESGMYRESVDIRKKYLDLITKNHFPAIEILIATWTLGATYLEIDRPDSAKIYIDQALAFPDGDIDIVAQKLRVWEWQANVLFNAGEKDSAISIQKRNLIWYDEKGFLLWALYASNYLGSFCYEAGDLSTSEKHFLESVKFINEMSARNSLYRHDSLRYTAVYGLEPYYPIPEFSLKEMMWSWWEWAYDGLFRIYQAKNDDAKALKYHILSMDAADSLSGFRSARAMVETQTRYESEQKERQIQYLSEQNAFKSFKLRQSRIVMFGLAGLITLVILLAIALIRQGMLREKQNNLILQQKLFRSQMNPHFIFNSLSSIHHFMIDEKPAKAASYLSKFSKLIRNILQGSTEEYTYLSNETGIIENYLELQKLRFPGKFEYKIEIDGSLDPDHTTIPSMITQPFVENAIEHGIRYKEEKGLVLVSFKLNADMITIQVEDDGIGREKARQFQSERDKDHHSLATSLIMDRIRALNRTLKKKITLDIIDLKDDRGEAAGTRVMLEVPLV